MVLWVQAGRSTSTSTSSDAGTRRCSGSPRPLGQRPDRRRLHGSPLQAQRAFIVASRGQEAEARSELETALETLDSNRDVQFQATLLNNGIAICSILGDFARCRELLERLLLVKDVGRFAHFAPPFAADFTAAVARCGYGERYLAEYADASPHRRLEASRLMWAGRPAEAAEIYASGSPQEEAAARLLAAEQLAAEGGRRKRRRSSSAALPSSGRSAPTRSCARRRPCSPQRPSSQCELPQRRNVVVSPPRARQSAMPPSSTGRASRPAACSTLAAIAARGPLSQIVTIGRPPQRPFSAACRAVR